MVFFSLRVPLASQCHVCTLREIFTSKERHHGISYFFSVCFRRHTDQHSDSARNAQMRKLSHRQRTNSKKKGEQVILLPFFFGPMARL